MRLLRSGMLEVLDSEYVKLARVKGVVEHRVIWLHALKNALIPVVTFAGIYFAILVTTAIVVETVFAWPGLGRLAYDGISSRDFPVIQAVVLTTAAIVARREPRRGLPLRPHRPPHPPCPVSPWRLIPCPPSARPARWPCPRSRRRARAAPPPPSRRPPGHHRRLRPHGDPRARAEPRGSARASRCATASSRRCGWRAGPRRISLGTDRLGPRHAVAHRLGLARVAGGGGGDGAPRQRVRRRRRPRRGLLRRPDGRRAHAGHRRHHVVPGDPARPHPRGDGGARASPTWWWPSR